MGEDKSRKDDEGEVLYIIATRTHRGVTPTISTSDCRGTSRDDHRPSLCGVLLAPIHDDGINPTLSGISGENDPGSCDIGLTQRHGDVGAISRRSGRLRDFNAGRRGGRCSQRTPDVNGIILESLDISEGIDTPIDRIERCHKSFVVGFELVYGS